MIRRRRRQREIPFSFDSFLDVVANVVGVIIRLILVVWVGARSYSALPELLKSRPPESAATKESKVAGDLRDPVDPLEQELARHRLELADAEKRLLDQLRNLELVQKEHAAIGQQVTGLQIRQKDVEAEKNALFRTTQEQSAGLQQVALSLAELRRRQQKLIEEIRELEKLPPLKHSLRYRTPVSKPVQAEEFMFECRNGRVTFIDVASLLAEVRRGIQDKGQELKSRWQVQDVAGPVGPFQLRYVVERQRDRLDSVISGAGPDARANFSYGVSEWTVEGIDARRGETLALALLPSSEFRQVVDVLDAQQAAVTFWIYPDSFELFRRLRDYLYERDIVVAGRPLPEGTPIKSSKHGSLSRGQ